MTTTTKQITLAEFIKLPKTKTAQLFKDISWGSDRVLGQTTNIAKKLGLNFDYLTTLNDIDRPEDLSIWEKYQD